MSINLDVVHIEKAAGVLVALLDHQEAEIRLRAAMSVIDLAMHAGCEDPDEDDDQTDESWRGSGLRGYQE